MITSHWLIYTYIHIYIYTYIHIYIYTYIHIYIYTYIHIHIYTHIYIYSVIYIYINYVNILVNTYIYISYQLINQLIIINSHLSIHIYIYIHTMYIYIYHQWFPHQSYMLDIRYHHQWLSPLPWSLRGGADEPGIQVVQVDDLCSQRLTSAKLMVGG